MSFLVSLLFALVPCPASAPLQASANQAPVVGVLETRATNLNEFLLHGTLPVPPGTYPRTDGFKPFTILDADGTPLATQVEIVSRYPDAAEGADVVELVARVHRDPAVPPGTILRYPVALVPHDDPVSLDDLEGVPASVRSLINDPTGIEINAYDCFGNRYSTRPLDRSSEVTVLRHGPLHAETRVYRELLPVSPVTGSRGTLPHFLGVHLYLSWFRGAEMVGLDLRFHNGHDGHDTSSPLDDPLGKLYFQRIEISLPQDWVALQDVQDPFLGPTHVAAGRNLRDLVAPLSGTQQGKLHVMRWGAQFHRRLMLAPSQEARQQEARGRLEAAGQAFCTRGRAADGREYWSWWNRWTARYFPQRHALPILDHVGAGNLVTELVSEFDFLDSHLRSGTGVGDYPIQDGVLGWGHPYGVAYGGMTSGSEIIGYDGVTLAAAASARGYRAYQLLHRMQTDRMPNALYAADGSPTSVEEWRVGTDSQAYVPFHLYVVPILFGSHPDPFGALQSPSFQRDFVAASGLEPAYEARHLAYDPHDYQHFVRYTRAPKVLAWLGNDSLAKEDLLMEAENFNLSYHQYLNGPGGNLQESGMRTQLDYVALHPGQGLPLGRGEAWGLDCAAAAYSLGTPEWRRTKLPWLQAFAGLVNDGQAACSGFIQAFVSNKAVDGHYRARQQIEQSITEHALVGLHESVFRGAHPGYAAMVRDVVTRSLYAFISEMAWFPGEPGPWRYTGVGPLDYSRPVWCSRAEMPPDAWTAGDIEAYQDWSSFAYGYELAHDSTFLTYARFQTGGAAFADLYQRLHDSGTSNLGNRSALLALVQYLNGDL